MEESNKRETKKYAQKEIVYSSPIYIYIYNLHHFSTLFLSLCSLFEWCTMTREFSCKSLIDFMDHLSLRLSLLGSSSFRAFVWLYLVGRIEKREKRKR